jgi:hypothetical protein
MSGENRLPVLAAEIRKAHADVQEAAKTAAQRAIEAGQALIEAKALMGHGQWLPWLREHCALAERTAQLYMKIAKSGLDSATVADLGLQAAGKAFAIEYPQEWDPFVRGEANEQREWLLFTLFLVDALSFGAEAAQQHIYWIARHDFASPDEWLGPEGQKWVRLWNGRIDPQLAERWQEFRAARADATFTEIGEAVQQAAYRAEPAGRPTGKRRRRGGL